MKTRKRKIQFHTNSVSPAKNNSKGQGSTFYGVGGGNHDRKKEFLAFFRIIDRGIAAELQDKNIPLVLAGVEYLMPIYREANSYSHLSDLHIPGANHATGPIEDLHAKASALLRAADHGEMIKALSEYRETLTTPRTVSGYTDVVPSACYKQLTHLFIRKGARQWGMFTPGDGRTDVFAEYRTGVGDMVNLASARTLLGHGKVYIVDADEMPAGSEIAGLFHT